MPRSSRTSTKTDSSIADARGLGRSSPDEIDPWAPEIVVAGRYRLHRLLGKGGMGVVWAATHVVTRKSVALKRLKSASVSEEQRRRFLREARITCSVDHPNVVDIHDIFEVEGGALIMVMELLAGESLAERLQRDVTIPLHETVEILLPVLAAVRAAHAIGVVHRDLKPANIFLLESSGERVKVLDFGIAKLMDEGGEAGAVTDLTESGARVGTPIYMSPEQVFGAREIDGRADIWALGLILYECLAGVLPTNAENMGQVLERIVSSGIPPLEDAAPNVPKDVAALVNRMLSRKREERPTAIEEVAEVLASHREEPESAPARPGQPAPTASAPKVSKERVILPGGGDPLASTEQLEGGTGPELDRPNRESGSSDNDSKTRRRLIAVAGALALAACLIIAGVWVSVSPPLLPLAADPITALALPARVEAGCRELIPPSPPPSPSPLPPSPPPPREKPGRAASATPQGYRGIVRRLDNNAMMRGSEVLLIGTSCTRKVGADGVFDFSGCEPEVVARIKAPRVQVTLPDRSGFCSNITLLPPPAITDISLNPQNCRNTVHIFSY